MSISKTHSLFISALLLLLLPACGIHSVLSSSRSQPEQAHDHQAAKSEEPALASEGGDADLPHGRAEQEELTAPEPEASLAQEIAELETLGHWEEGTSEPVAVTNIQFDFPVTINKQVEFYLDFFQNEQRISFSRWLARSGRYLPMIEEHLREAGLPLDLVYLPMIESGYSSTAYSRAKAVGPWQFMSGTATHYGLRIDSYLDERRDPIKSTRAAIQYLSELYREFDHWHLAVASYNGGQGRIRGAMRRNGAENFWQLSRHLPTETKRYVPKLIAAIMIAREPEKYGFTNIVYDAPLEFETVTVPPLTPLEAVAAAGDADLEELRELNRELRQAITPPWQAGYVLKVPTGKGDLVARNLSRVRPVVSTDYKTHVVGRQETIARICSKYNLNRTTLLKANSLRSAALTPGQRLRIPFQTTTYKLLSEKQVAGTKPGSFSSENLVLHTIRAGETVTGIAKTYNVPAHLVVTWNDLPDVNRIRAGQQLALYLAEKESGQPPEETVLAPGTFKLAALAGRKAETRPAASPRPAAESPAASSAVTYYQVQGGDTLWEISRRFNVSTDQIKRWNQLQNDRIHPGLRLLLRVDENRDVNS
jgi:membrane-bound lytic murein transglycosylase D